MTSTTQLTPRCYETPTVTLEVMVREAAISQWSEVPIVQVLRFQLQIRSLDGDVAPVEIRGDRDAFLGLHQAIQLYIQNQLVGEEILAGDRSSQLPYLEAEGLIRHRLYLGGLKTPSGEASMTLGAIQLADLGDVLEQLDTQVRLLPVALTPSRRRRPWRQWGGVAAGVVAAVGLTTTLWPFYQSQNQVSETALEAPMADQEAIPAPAYPEGLESSRAAQATPPPEEEPANVPGSDASAEVAEAVPQFDDLDLQPFPETNVKANPSELGVSPSDSTLTPKPILGPPAPSASDRDEAVAASPTAPTSASPPTSTPASPPAPAEPEAPASPVPPAASTSHSETEVSADSEDQPASVAEAAGGDSALQEVLTERTATASDRGSDLGVADVPNDTQRGLPGNNSTSVANATPDGGDSFVLPETAPQSETIVEAPTVETATAVPNFTTLASEISEQWMPSAELTQTLTYTLKLKADGTLAEIIPADELSDRYRDRAGLPSLGTRILPPPNPSQIKVLLYPSGNAQVIPVVP